MADPCLGILLAAADNGGFVVLGDPAPHSLLKAGLLRAAPSETDDPPWVGFELTAKGWDLARQSSQLREGGTLPVIRPPDL